MLSGVIRGMASQLRINALRTAVGGLLLVVFALLPATAWVHERLEAAETPIFAHTDHHDSSTPVQHHDESRCRVCQMIHSCTTQVIFVAPLHLASHDACEGALLLSLPKSPSIALFGVHSSRAPHANS